jgi:hypothetical protein
LHYMRWGGFNELGLHESFQTILLTISNTI